MDQKTPVDRFSKLSRDGQIHLIAWSLHDFTVYMRNYYSDIVTPDREFWSLNEVTHSMTSQIGHLIASTPRYPDDIFIAIVLEKARRGGSEPTLLWAFERAFSYRSLNDLESQV